MLGSTRPIRRLSTFLLQLLLVSTTIVTTATAAVARLPITQAHAISPSSVSEFQPNIGFGGRSVSVDVAPGQNQVALVATESGGLFKTLNRGGSWSHVDGLLPFRMSDVKYAPTNGNIVIATTWQNSDSSNQGGIYRSTDGGGSWTKSTQAFNSPICGGGNFFANGIAFEPGSSNLYVGTACGLAVSPDLGATWTVTFLPSFKQVQTVVAQSGGIINLCADDGLYRYTNTGGVLTRTNGPVTLPGGSATCFQGNGYVPNTHNLGASPQETNVLFTVGTGSSTSLCGGTVTNPAGILILFESDDSGATWNSLGSNTFRCGSRQPFIGTHLQGAGPNFDVYWSGGLDVSHATCKAGGPGNRCTSLPSSPNVTIAHSDFGGMAFDPTSDCAEYLVSDGGVQGTSDCGKTFTMAGTSGPNGFGGLQIYQVTGQVIGGGGSTNLIFGTQDNNIYGSTDNGATWPNSTCCEGFNFQLQHSVASHSGQVLTGVACSGCGDIKAKADLTGVGGWPDPPAALGSNPGSDAGGPVFLDQKVYSQWTLDTATPPNSNLDITTDTGGTWNAVTNATIPTVGAGAGPLMSTPRVSGTPAAPILYQAYCTSNCGFIAPAGGLKQISGVRTGTATVSAADTGLTSLGTYNDGYGAFLLQEPAFGVDPSNSAHLIAADVGTNSMKVSTSSGTSWTTDTSLSNFVTDFGRYSFVVDNSGIIGSQAHAIAFDPANGNLILVGTEAAGIIASIDGGTTWQRMLGSKSVSAVTSFFFDEVNNDIVASSYGRGLWKLDMTRRAATLDYTGDTHDDFNDSATLSAHLYDSANGPSSPIAHVNVNFALGSQSCSGFTNNNGVASCVIPTITQNAGASSVTASYAGDAQWLPQTTTVPFTIDREDTALTYTGATTQDYHDPATMSAHLFDPTGNAPIAGKTLTFTLGVGDSCTSTSPTDASGNASCTIVPTQQAGNYPVVVNFAGDGNYLPASTTFFPFVITEEETTTTYTGDTLIANARTAHMSGVLKEDGVVPISGRPLLFTLGSGITAQTCTGITDATGTGRCDILVNQPLGPGTVRVDFDPTDVDEFYKPSFDTAVTLVFGFLDRGAMVIGDQDVALNTTVEFWGSDWAKVNSLSGGPAPDAFKGFASDTSTNPPVCGVQWTARPGNSGNPPDTVPSYMGIYVSSSITKKGSTTTGDVFEIVVVKTDPGYAGNPGHHGTGTLVASPSMPSQPAVFCHA